MTKPKELLNFYENLFKLTLKTGHVNNLKTYKQL